MAKNRMTKLLLPYYLLTGFLFMFELVIAKEDVSILPVIFETDMGNDVDDALALAMLFRYADQRKIELLGVINNKESLSSVQFLDVMRRQYGYSDLPIATVRHGVEGEEEQKSFARKVMDHKETGKPVFGSVINDYNEVDSAVGLYRRLLSAAKDRSVVIISVGFSTNLAALLRSKPDRLSTLTGYELVMQKVKYLSAMAGSFELQPAHREFNIISDIPAAQTFFTRWPTPIYVSPFEVGNAIHFPADVILQNLGYQGVHPLVQAYRLYLPMPYNRETWDLTAVLFGIEPQDSYFKYSPKGQITVDDAGYTHFLPDPNGKHFYLLTPTLGEIERVEKRFVELIKAL